MSHIFEALQRAEEERSGGISRPPAESVADLLCAADSLQTAEAEREDLTVEQFDQFPPVLDAEAGVESFGTASVLMPTPSDLSRLVCLTDQGSLAAEQFRVLGLRLRHLREERKLQRIVVTSSSPGEGKSFIAANLAFNQARSKILKTLLLDGDLRRPALASRLGFSRSLPGLSECLRGERKLTEAVYKLDRSELWFLPAGMPPQNPIDLMQSGRLSTILAQLGAFFDWIIIDTPPILPLADTPLWMKLADGVLLVTREGVSEKNTLARGVKVIRPESMIGLVVNSCAGTGERYYYSHYGRNPIRSESAASPQVDC